MSADNYVAIKRIKNRWHVWMVLGGYSEEQWLIPGGHFHRDFTNRMKAYDYARQICSEEIVEYGITDLG